VSASPQTDSVLPCLPPTPIGTEERPYTRYVARQPILDRDQNTHGYELLFRSGPENFFHFADPDLATSRTIDFSLLFGTPALTGGRPAFINCTRNILLNDVITLLPRDRVVIEVLEDVIADKKTIAACDRLRRAGYLIALDDYTPTADTLRMLPFAHMSKWIFWQPTLRARPPSPSKCAAAASGFWRKRSRRANSSSLPCVSDTTTSRDTSSASRR